MHTAVLVGALVAVVAGVAWWRDALLTRGPLTRSRSGSRRYDRAYERSRRRPGRG
jgi:hypothetical protein